MSKLSFEIDVEPKHLFRSISGFKYNLHEAIGDLTDNSVDALATKIWISISKSEIVIADNGSGMKLEELKTAITPWAANEGKHRSGKRGVHGIGLKSASFSLGEKLEVHTKHSKGEFLYLKLGISELIQKTGKTFEYSTAPTDLYKQYRLSSGTVVRISGINTRKVTQVAIEKLKGEIGLMFFRLIEKNKISILINDEKVEAIHPLLPDLKKNSNPNYKVQRDGNSFIRSGNPENYYHDYGKQIIKFAKEDGGKTQIAIHAVHIGRGSHWSNSEKAKHRFFLKKNIAPNSEADTGLLKLDEQGIYLMRNDRLITLGGWLGIHRVNTLLHHDVSCRVLIEYNSEDDEVIGVDHTKTKPDIVSALKDAIRDQYLQKVLQDSEARFRDEGNIISTKRQEKAASEELKSRPRTSSVWGKKFVEAEKIKKKSDPEFDKKHQHEEYKKKEEAKTKTEWLQVVDHLPYNCLWQAEKNKEGHTILYLNERHPGYSSLYHEYSKDKTRVNLNLFFYHLSSFEVDIDMLMDDLSSKEKELLQKALKELRKYVSRQMADLEEPL